MTLKHDREMKFASGQLVHPTYRPDIDGLRAVAVLSVVGFHAFPGWVKGGFVGVDIFFVISGFLISTILFSSLERNIFSFVNFYNRRIRRIFPALCVVLIACYGFGWFSLLANEYKQLGAHTAAGAGFVSNLVYWNETGYFATAAETKLLLHLWSLGIEEQFYIMWPLLTWVAWKKRINLLTITIIVATLSLTINIADTSDRIGDFFSPQTRFWELLAGSILAYLFLHNRQYRSGFTRKLEMFLGKIFHAKAPNRFSATLRDVQSLLGALFLSISLLVINRQDRFPGTWALLPVLGTVMIIHAGKNALLNRAILSNPILVWFGLISFPLYLWHWPLLTFMGIIEGETPSLAARIVAVLISIAFAWMTYRFVEKPVRLGINSGRKSIFLVIAMLAIGAIGYLTYTTDGLPFRLKDSRKIHVQSVRQQIDNYEQLEITRRIWNGVPAIKSRDFLIYKMNPNKMLEIAVLGDSHANRLYLGLQNQSHFSVINIGRGTCPPFLNVDVVESSLPGTWSCQPLINNYLNWVRNNEGIQVVIINAYYGLYDGTSSYFGNAYSLVSFGKKIGLAEALTTTIKFLTDGGKKVVVALDVPEVNRECYGGKRKIPVWNRDNNGLCVIQRSVQNEAGRAIRDVVSGLEKKSNRVFLYDPADILCKGIYCGEIDQENYLYGEDGNHLNDFGVDVVGRDFSHYIDQHVMSKMSKG